VENCLSRNVEDSFKNFPRLDPDPNAELWTTSKKLISSFLSVDLL